MMEDRISQISVCLLSLLLLPQADSTVTAVLCQEWEVTGNQINLIMNTSLIAGTTGSCSCRISIDVHSRPSVFVQIPPNCTTNIELSHTIFMCDNDIYNASVNSSVDFKLIEDEFWVIVKLDINTEELGSDLSESIQIKSLLFYGSKPLSLECFEPNTNSWLTTTVDSKTTLETSTLTPNTNSLSTTTVASTTSSETYTLTPSNRSYVGQAHSPISEENIDAMPANAERQSDWNNNLTVHLIAGCGSGGLVLVIGMVFIAVTCHRQRKKKPRRAKDDKMTTTPSSFGTNDDEYLAMENELYTSAADLNRASYPHQSTLRDLTNIETYDNLRNGIRPGIPGRSIVDGRRDNFVEAPNGDLYATVDKHQNSQVVPGTTILPLL